MPQIKKEWKYLKNQIMEEEVRTYVLCLHCSNCSKYIRALGYTEKETLAKLKKEIKGWAVDFPDLEEFDEYADGYVFCPRCVASQTKHRAKWKAARRLK